ncbi:hypothetical protein ACFFX0_13770 [Citricoccus parietis]|uniref:Uncharacterized protein n=1 Tax=Citricoccus parietis TaxID=592307 RepID=A0ABV5FZW6_9MICC
MLQRSAPNATAPPGSDRWGAVASPGRWPQPGSGWRGPPASVMPGDPDDRFPHRVRTPPTRLPHPDRAGQRERAPARANTRRSGGHITAESGPPLRVGAPPRPSPARPALRRVLARRPDRWRSARHRRPCRYGGALLLHAQGEHPLRGARARPSRPAGPRPAAHDHRGAPRRRPGGHHA